MPAMTYADIGHTPGQSPIAHWWIDASGILREEVRDPRPMPPALFETHLEHHAPDPAPVACGRVEIDTSRGTIRLLGIARTQVGTVLDLLEQRYPRNTWYVFEHAA